jgi:hypothetical protein
MCIPRCIGSQMQDDSLQDGSKKKIWPLNKRITTKYKVLFRAKFICAACWSARCEPTSMHAGVNWAPGRLPSSRAPDNPGVFASRRRPVPHTCADREGRRRARAGHRRCHCAAKMGDMRAAGGAFIGPTAPQSPEECAGRWVSAQLRPAAGRSRPRRRATAAPDKLGYFAVRGALERAFIGRSAMPCVFRNSARASKGSVTRQR